jgi:hypothetical protein
VSTQYFRFPSRPIAEPRRAALLERLLACADGVDTAEDWRADAFQFLARERADMPGIASAALFSDGAATGAFPGAGERGWVCLATPVSYLADMTSVRLQPDGILSMTHAAAAALAADFNRVWLDAGCRMVVGGSTHLYCFFDRALDVVTRDPEEALGDYIEEYLPAGADAPDLRRLMSELEMWVHEHDANKTRENSSLPRINGLWLWGGGPPLASLPAIDGWIAGDDVFFNAFKSRDAFNPDDAFKPHDPRGTAGGLFIASAAPGSDGWGDVERRWLKPALRQLRSGTLGQIRISAGRRGFTVTARGMRRFWRRSSPWWESFA